MSKKPRDYAKEYATYHGTEEQKKNRAMRNAARNKLLKSGTVSKGDGLDVHHTTALSEGGTNNGNTLRAVPAKNNRSFARGSSKEMLSETSKRERKHGNSK